MKFTDIPTRLGFTQAGIAQTLGIRPQSIGPYFQRATRGKVSKVVRDVCAVLDLSMETVFFQDAFDHPEAEDLHHHLSAAIECLEMAGLAGADLEEIERLKRAAFALGRLHLPE